MLRNKLAVTVMGVAVISLAAGGGAGYWIAHQKYNPQSGRLWTIPLAFTFSNGGYCFFAAWDFICFLGDALSRAKCQYHVVGWYCYRDWRYGRCRNCNG